jgi:HSP20 family protein
MAQSVMRPSREEMVRHERPEFSPAVDVFDRDEEIVLVADMPGVAGDAVDIQLDKGVLTIRGRVQPFPSLGAMVFQEYQLGDFVRTFTVTEDVDPAGISAELKNGVLTLRLPKSAERKPRKITVKTG